MRGIRLHPFISLASALAAVAFATSPGVAGTTGVIKGTVSDAAGHPLAAVHVSVVSPTYRGATVTNGSGFYVVTGLPVDTYTVTFSKEGYQIESVPGITVVQDQNVDVDAKLQAEIKTLGHVLVRGATSLIQPTVTADTYTINQNILQNLNGTPQDLNGFAAFNSLPGVTTDSAGYPVIRAGAENDVGYAYDGVDNTDPITGQFLNGLSLNGTRSIELSTGGYDVSNGNTNSGVINQVIKRGAYPGAGQMTLRWFSPAYGHELSMDWGSATPDNRFSYYFSFGGQRDAFTYGDGHTVQPLLVALSDYTTTDDTVGNVYYHFGKNNENEIQLLADVTAGYFGFGSQVNAFQSPYAPNNGNVQLGTEISGSTTPIFESDFITLYPGEATYRQNIGYVDSQTFNSLIEKINYKRQFSANAYADFRIFRTMENLIFRYPYDLGSFTDFYEDLNTQGNGIGLDYTNQLSSKNELGFGGDIVYFRDQYTLATPSFEPFDAPLEAGCPLLSGATGTGGCYIAPLNAAINADAGLCPSPPCLPTDAAHAPLSTFPSDFSYSNDPVTRFNTYIKDLYQPNDRLTVDAGVRFDEQIYHLPGNIPQANEFYIIDDAGNYVTQLGNSVGSDVTRPTQISPRLAVSQKVGSRDVLRFSYGKNIEFEPLSGVEDTYQVNPALASCNIPSGCFQPLQGYSPTCVNGVDPANANAPCNDISNLYQQIIVDENTNNFAQYTPVRPQRAVNVDMSIEHDFGNGIELKISPYYRKGTDYVVFSSNLLFTLPSGKPVFSPARALNAGVNKNTGVEFEIQRQAQYGLSGLFDVTYDNTLANYDSDFFPSANLAAITANHFFHVSYVAPITSTLNLDYATPSGFHASVTIPYESGYRYGVGKKTFIFEPEGPGGANIPVEVLNTDLAASTPADAYYFTDPTNPGTADNPNIIGSRGTAEGDDPGTLHGPAIATVNLSVSHELGSPRNWEVGFRVENLFRNFTPGNYSAQDIPNNPYYINNGFGAFGPGSGANPNIGIEPYQYNYGPFSYENEPIGQPQTWTVFVSMKY